MAGHKYLHHYPTFILVHFLQETNQWIPTYSGGYAYTHLTVENNHAYKLYWDNNNATRGRTDRGFAGYLYQSSQIAFPIAISKVSNLGYGGWLVMTEVYDCFKVIL